MTQWSEMNKLERDYRWGCWRVEVESFEQQIEVTWVLWKRENQWDLKAE